MDWGNIYQISKPFIEAGQATCENAAIILSTFLIALTISVAREKSSKPLSKRILLLLPLYLFVGGNFAYVLPIIYKDPYTIEGLVKEKVTWDYKGKNYAFMVKVKNSQFYGPNGLGKKKAELINTITRVKVPRRIFRQAKINEKVLLALTSDTDTIMLGKIANHKIEIFKRVDSDKSIKIDLKTNQIIKKK